jgi:hypothetical protein
MEFASLSATLTPTGHWALTSSVHAKNGAFVVGFEGLSQQLASRSHRHKDHRGITMISVSSIMRIRERLTPMHDFVAKNDEHELTED